MNELEKTRRENALAMYLEEFGADATAPDDFLVCDSGQGVPCDTIIMLFHKYPHKLDTMGISLAVYHVKPIEEGFLYARVDLKKWDNTRYSRVFRN